MRKPVPFSSKATIAQTTSWFFVIVFSNFVFQIILVKSITYSNTTSPAILINIKLLLWFNEEYVIH